MKTHICQHLQPFLIALEGRGLVLKNPLMAEVKDFALTDLLSAFGCRLDGGDTHDGHHHLRRQVRPLHNRDRDRDRDHGRGHSRQHEKECNDEVCVKQFGSQ